MDELGEKLDALLHDPQQLGRIAQLASSLVGDGGETPYLAEKRRRKIDRAMKLARLASLAELAAGEMGEDDDV